MRSKEASMSSTGDALTLAQLRAITIVERVGGSVSLVSIVLIFVAYGLVRTVRNVQNTFIVFASVSNVGASIASIIAMDGLHKGTGSAICQAQSFMFEMFMQSDPWWSLAMAINVFMVFYFRTSPDSFKKWWWLYCLICYGGPFVFALALLVVRVKGRPPVYGQATIWCWVDQSWDEIRIYTYYMLIWMCILGSFLLYALVGYYVFHSRNQFRSFSASKDSRDNTFTERSRPEPESSRDGAYGTVTTEVQIVHTATQSGHPLIKPKNVHKAESSHVGFQGNVKQSTQAPAGQYFSTVTSVPKPYRRPHDQVADETLADRAKHRLRVVGRRFIVADPIKRAYLRTSLLYAVSVLVTWIPSSLNRINGWRTGSSPFEYNMAAATVLPLQGLWNGVIFFITSWASLKKWYLGERGGRWTDTERSGSVNRTATDSRLDRHITRHRDPILDSDTDYDREGSEIELTGIEPGPGKTSDGVSA